MLFDIYMILMTSFAVFGAYCFLDMFCAVCCLRGMPKSITILNYSSDKFTRRKVKIIQDTVGNNDIVLLSGGTENIYENTQITSFDGILKHIDGSLFTNG